MTTDLTIPRKWVCEDEATPEAKMYQALRFISDDLAAGAVQVDELVAEVERWIDEAQT